MGRTLLLFFLFLTHCGEVQSAQKPLYISSSFSLSRWQGFGFGSGIGLAAQKNEFSPWMGSLESQLTLVSGGSLFSLGLGLKYSLFGTWKTPRSFQLGGFLGAGFPGGGLTGDSQVGVFSLELAYQKRIDPYTYTRLFASPGLIGKNFSMQIGLILLFRVQ